MRFLQVGADQLPGRLEQLECAGVAHPVVDARPLPARLEQSLPPHRRQVLGGAAGVDPQLGLQRADRQLPVPQQLQNAYPRWMTKGPEEVRLDSVDRFWRSSHVTKIAYLKKC